MTESSPSSVDEKVRNTLQLDQNAENGQQLYATNCAQCHGAHFSTVSSIVCRYSGTMAAQPN
ncbi:c-type cytochrome [Peristeroidobacter agariperforans]|uniref:c-type cytochrome n=1 Tax=Peristeroidobacter agariperforans TaxID=268404 RepID=UPI00389A1364